MWSQFHLSAFSFPTPPSTDDEMAAWGGLARSPTGGGAGVLTTSSHSPTAGWTLSPACGGHAGAGLPASLAEPPGPIMETRGPGVSVKGRLPEDGVALLCLCGNMPPAVARRAPRHPAALLTAALSQRRAAPCPGLSDLLGGGPLLMLSSAAPPPRCGRWIDGWVGDKYRGR